MHCAPPSQTAAAAQSCILCFLLLRPLRPQLRKNLDDEGREREEGEPLHCCLVAASTTTCAGSAGRLRDHAHLPSRGKSIYARDREFAAPKTTLDLQVLMWHSSNLPRTLKPKEPEQQCLGLRGTPPSLVWAKKVPRLRRRRVITEQV